MAPFWIDTGNALRLAIVPRPRGGDWLFDDVKRLREAGVDVLVSMLPPQEAEELGLAFEDAACQEGGIEFRSFSIPDRQVPASREQLRAFVTHLREKLHEGKSVAVHCRASIGRSSLLLASILCFEGFSARDAFALISSARGLQVPDTSEQVSWVEDFAKHMSLQG